MNRRIFKRYKRNVKKYPCNEYIPDDIKATMPIWDINRYISDPERLQDIESATNFFMQGVKTCS